MATFLTPKMLMSFVERSTRGAVANAQGASEALSRSVDERRTLADDMAPEGGGPAQGSITRLSRATCLELLATRRVGRLAYIARAGTPDIVPVNYLFIGGHLLIRSGPGPKLQAAERGDAVAFEVDDIDEVGRTGWSVVIAGEAVRLSATERLRLPEDDIPAPWTRGTRTGVIKMTPRRIDGRRLN